MQFWAETDFRSIYIYIKKNTFILKLWKYSFCLASFLITLTQIIWNYFSIILDLLDFFLFFKLTLGFSVQESCLSSRNFFHLLLTNWFGEKLHPGRQYSSQGGRGLPHAGRVAAQPKETCHRSGCRCSHGSNPVGGHSSAGPHNQRGHRRRFGEPLRNAGRLQDGVWCLPHIPARPGADGCVSSTPGLLWKKDEVRASGASRHPRPTRRTWTPWRARQTGATGTPRSRPWWLFSLRLHPQNSFLRRATKAARRQRSVEIWWRGDQCR